MKINLIGECLNKLWYNNLVEYFIDIKNNNFIEKYFILLENVYDTLSEKVGNIVIFLFCKLCK